MVAKVLVFTLIYFLSCIIIYAVRLALHGTFIGPNNYDYRFVTNFKKIKIQLKMPNFWIPFANIWEDYKIATSFEDSINMIYQTKYFNSVEEAEEYVDKYKETSIQQRKNNYFEQID